MEEIFDNAELIQNMSPNAEVITKLRIQRNLAMVIGLAGIFIVGYICYVKSREEKNKLLAKNNSSNFN